MNDWRKWFSHSQEGFFRRTQVGTVLEWVFISVKRICQPYSKWCSSCQDGRCLVGWKLVRILWWMRILESKSKEQLHRYNATKKIISKSTKTRLCAGSKREFYVIYFACDWSAVLFFNSALKFCIFWLFWMSMEDRPDQEEGLRKQCCCLNLQILKYLRLQIQTNINKIFYLWILMWIFNGWWAILETLEN